MVRHWFGEPAGRNPLAGSSPVSSAFASLKLGFGVTKSAFGWTKSSLRRDAVNLLRSNLNIPQSCCWLACYAGSPADFRRKIEFLSLPAGRQVCPAKQNARSGLFLIFCLIEFIKSVSINMRVLISTHTNTIILWKL